MKGSLKQISPDDYVLQDGMGAWVGVGTLDIRIRTIQESDDETVEVNIYPRHHADLDSLGGCSASCSEAREAGGHTQRSAAGKGGKGNLTKSEDKDAPEDYDMRKSVESVWIGYKEIDIHIIKTDEGVVVDLYPCAEDYSVTLGSTWVLFSEGEVEEKESGNPAKALFLKAFFEAADLVAEDRKSHKPGCYPDTLYVGYLDSHLNISLSKHDLLPKPEQYKGLPIEKKGVVISNWFKKHFTLTPLTLVLCEEIVPTSGTDTPDAYPEISVTGIRPDGIIPIYSDITLRVRKASISIW